MRLLRGLVWNSLLLAVLGLSALSVAQTDADAPTAQSDHGSSENSAMTQAASQQQKSEAVMAELPESPGAVQFNSKPQSGSPPSLAAAVPPAQTQSSTPAQTQPSQSAGTINNSAANPQQPVGTAAAPAPVVSGTAAARPAGVAVAPAKQHRVRTIVIKVGAVAAAAVAIGTVVALSEATSSRPPGAH